MFMMVLNFFKENIKVNMQVYLFIIAFSNLNFQCWLIIPITKYFILNFKKLLILSIIIIIIKIMIYFVIKIITVITAVTQVSFKNYSLLIAINFITINSLQFQSIVIAVAIVIVAYFSYIVKMTIIVEDAAIQH